MKNPAAGDSASTKADQPNANIPAPAEKPKPLMRGKHDSGVSLNDPNSVF